MYVIDFPEAKPVIVQEMVVVQNEMGEIISESWEQTGTINVEIWALRGNQTRGKMGVTEKSTHELFSADAVKSNTRIFDGVNTYLVGYTPPFWGTHYTAILEMVT